MFHGTHLIVDLDGPESVERVMADEGDGRMIGLDERHRVLVAHQTVDGEP